MHRVAPAHVGLAHAVEFDIGHVQTRARALGEYVPAVAVEPLILARRIHVEDDANVLALGPLWRRILGLRVAAHHERPAEQQHLGGVPTGGLVRIVRMLERSVNRERGAGAESHVPARGCGVCGALRIGRSGWHHTRQHAHLVLAILGVVPKVRGGHYNRRTRRPSLRAASHQERGFAGRVRRREASPCGPDARAMHLSHAGTEDVNALALHRLRRAARGEGKLFVGVQFYDHRCGDWALLRSGLE